MDWPNPTQSIYIPMPKKKLIRPKGKVMLQNYFHHLKSCLRVTQRNKESIRRRDSAEKEKKSSLKIKRKTKKGSREGGKMLPSQTKYKLGGNAPNPKKKEEIIPHSHFLPSQGLP